MRERIFIGLLLMGASYIMYAQTPGSTSNIKFVRETNPVPAQATIGTNPAGVFYHALYTGSAWGDYNNDGFLDIFYSDRNVMINENTVYANLYTNNGDGTFTRPKTTIKGTAFSCPVWFDMNNDGQLDLMLPGLTNWHYYWLHENTDYSGIGTHLYINQGIDTDGNVTFKEYSAKEIGLNNLYNGKTGGKGHNWVSTGDYDNDGYTDILMTGFEDGARFDTDSPEEAVRAVYLYKNINGERFERQTTACNGGEFHGLTDGSVRLCDLDNDGFLDILATGYGATRASEIYVYWNTGNGTFIESDQQFKGVTDASCDVCDINNDGFPELVATGVYVNTNTKCFFLYKNLGNRTFEELECPELEGIDGGQLSFGDVNHDGLTDILVGGHGATNEHTTCIYVNQGDFTFVVNGAHYDDPFGKKGHFGRVTHGSQHLIDYNNDGYLDVWSTGWVSGGCGNGCAVELWYNTSSTKGVTANVAPGTPSNLTASYNAGNSSVTFSWSDAQDDITPTTALRYNLYLRKKGSDKCFITVPADLTTGFVRVGRISGDITRSEYTMTIPDEGVYEWGVQAIDNGNVGGLFAHSTFSTDGSGINNISDESPIKIWNTGTTLYYSLPEIGTISIYSINGSLIKCMQAGISGNTTLPTGIYIVEIKTDSSIRHQKIAIP
ncbi:MAG: T9SS type A sorting domain-containing protein [Coprobacter sp.]|nr:T9SS type A sorting domain-containing protein [Coprobacter sp.]